MGGVDPSITNYFGSSVICSPYIPARVLRYFVTHHNVSPTAVNEYLQTPLHLVAGGHFGFHYSDNNGKFTPPSSKGTFRGRAVSVSTLIQLKANVNALDNKRQTPLIYAIKEGVSGRITRLAHYLLTISYRQEINIVRLLLRSGANPTIRDIFGSTAFDFADSSCIAKRSKIIQALQTARLNMRLRVGNRGKSPVKH